ncbi:unnamed protein product, partial [Clonostachys chloroleuca]
MSPAAMHKLAHPDGELATSRAAADLGVCMGLSSYATESIENVAAVGKGNPHLNEYRNSFILPDDMTRPNLLSDGKNELNGSDNRGVNGEEVLGRLSHDYDASLDWATAIPWLRKHTKLQIWVKGIYSVDDMRAAIEYGVDGVLISNHGGRQLDGVPVTIDVLRQCAPVPAGALLMRKSYKEAIECDLVEAVAVIRYYAGWADKTFGQTISTSHQRFAYTIRQPIGVIAQIIPWNYPLCMAIWKLGPALACANTVVLKPAEQTPLSIVVPAELIKEAGFPPGVVNIVNGPGRETGSALANQFLIDKIASTGSTQTAVNIMRAAAKTLKNITLEIGGKSPLLVFNAADLKQAVKWSHFGIMSNQVFVETTESVSKIGYQWSKDTDQGPLVSKAQHERVLEYLSIGKTEGAVIATGVHAVTVGTEGKGFWVAPTVFNDVKPSMRVFQEEIFGPVAVIAKFKTEDEAIALAKNTKYGLGSALFTTDLERAHRVAQEIEAGMASSRVALAENLVRLD